MHQKRARRIWGGWKKSELSPASEEDGWHSLARRSQASGLVAGATRLGGADGKSSIKRLCLSPYVEKPFNSKVINSFVPELRSRKWFSCFEIPMFSVYMLWTFYVRYTYPYHGYGTKNAINVTSHGDLSYHFQCNKSSVWKYSEFSIIINFQYEFSRWLCKLLLRIFH